MLNVIKKLLIIFYLKIFLINKDNKYQKLMGNPAAKAIQNLIQTSHILNNILKKIILLENSIPSKHHLIIPTECKWCHLLSIVNYKRFIKVLLLNRELIHMRKIKDALCLWPIQTTKTSKINKLTDWSCQIIHKPKRQRQLTSTLVLRLLEFQNLLCMIKWWWLKQSQQYLRKKQQVWKRSAMLLCLKNLKSMVTNQEELISKQLLWSLWLIQTKLALFHNKLILKEAERKWSKSFKQLGRLSANISKQYSR